MLKPSFEDNPTAKIQRHLKSIHELIKLATDLDSIQIAYITLKGVSLNQLLYGNQLVRVSRDIDILIQSKDIQAVHNYLVARGYQLQHPFSIAHLIGKPQNFLNYLDEVVYWHPLKNIFLDLKWHISSRNYFGMAWCDIKKYAVIHMNSHSIKILNQEENFYYLCTHAAKHRWEYHQWLQDLAVLSQKFNLCWDKIITLAQNTKSVRALLEAKILLYEKFNIQLKEIPYSFWDNIVVKFKLRLIKSDWFNRLKDSSKFKNYVYTMLELCLYPKISQKCHYIKRLFVTRHASLRQISRFKNPKLYKMILYSFIPVWNKYK